MNKKTFVLTLIISMILSVFPNAILASAPVTLDAITNKNPGDAFEIKGTSTFSSVNIKVIRPNNTVLLFDTLAVTGGNFSATYTLTPDALLGEYNVSVGVGTTVAKKVFTVESPSGGDNTGNPPNGGGDNTGNPPSGGGGNTGNPPSGGGGNTGGNGGGNPPAGSAPPANNTVNANNPINSDISNHTLKLSSDALKVEKDKSATGQEITKVKIDDKKLQSAFLEMKEKKLDTNTVTVEIANTNGSAKFEIAAAVLLAANKDNPNAILAVKTEKASFHLPLSVLNANDIAQKFGTNASDVKINITMEKVDSSTEEKVKSVIKNSGISSVGPAIDFHVTAEANGKIETLNDFGGVYVPRTIVIDHASSSSILSAVLYDPITNKVTFVPAVMKIVNGQIEVVILVPHNSIYTVVESHKTFADISKHWAKQEIELLASKLVIKGQTETKFSPNANITRAEFASLLVSALSLPSGEASNNFADVNSSDWYSGAVAAAVKSGLVTGYSNKTFKPKENITRQQMAVMISRALKLANKPIDVTNKQDQLLAKFKDYSKIAPYAKSAVAESIEAGIITGKTSTTFVHDAYATRAEATVMLKRLMQYVGFMN